MKTSLHWNERVSLAKHAGIPVQFFGRARSQFRGWLPASERALAPSFLQRNGYKHNQIARRTGTIAVFVAAIEAKMDSALQALGTKRLAPAFWSGHGPIAIVPP
jgi:hypothetical protein